MASRAKDSGDAPTGTVGREIQFPHFYDELVAERMRERSINRSEAVRSFINEAIGRGGRVAALEVRQKLGAIKLHVATAKVLPSKAAHHLSEVDAAVDAIGRIVTESLG